MSASAPTAVRRRRLIAVAVTVAVFLLLVLVAQLTQRSPAQSAADPDPTSTATGSADPGIAKRVDGDPMALGAVDAPVVLTEWTDMRCPFCAVFSRDVLPTLIQEYVDAGLVRIEVQDVAFFGDQSVDAAVAARAAGEQGKYFDYLHVMYAAAPEDSHPELPRETLIAFAEQAGVPDLDGFTADLDDADLRAAVQASNTTAQQLGVSSVPFFVAGNTAMAGAQPLDTFRDFLDQALEQVG